MKSLSRRSIIRGYRMSGTRIRGSKHEGALTRSEIRSAVARGVLPSREEVEYYMNSLTRRQRLVENTSHRLKKKAYCSMGRVDNAGRNMGILRGQFADEAISDHYGL